MNVYSLPARKQRFPLSMTVRNELFPASVEDLQNLVSQHVVPSSAEKADWLLWEVRRKVEQSLKLEHHHLVAFTMKPEDHRLSILTELRAHFEHVLSFNATSPQAIPSVGFYFKQLIQPNGKSHNPDPHPGSV